MREKGPIKGYIVLVNDDTGESTFFEAEPLHLDGSAYDLLMSGKGQVIANVSVDTNFGLKYFSTQSGVIQSTVDLGTANGTATTFSGSANGAIYAGSVKVKAGDSVVGQDDGNGNITGDGVTGTVNYTTGEISVTFSTAPANGTEITADVMKNCC